MDLAQSDKLADVCYDIRGPVLAEAKRLEALGHSIIKLNIGNPAPFGFTAPDEILVDVIAHLRASERPCCPPGHSALEEVPRRETAPSGRVVAKPQVSGADLMDPVQSSVTPRPPRKPSLHLLGPQRLLNEGSGRCGGGSHPAPGPRGHTGLCVWKSSRKDNVPGPNFTSLTVLPASSPALGGGCDQP